MRGPGEEDDEPLPDGDIAHSTSVAGDQVDDTLPAASAAGSATGSESATVFDGSVAVKAMRHASRVVPRPGEAIGERNRFNIIEALGTGGMGFVCRAHDRELDRNVAIKFIQRGHDLPWPQLTALLRQEAKATAKLNHENIVSIFDIGTWGRVPFLVMEHLEGETLSRMMRREPPSAERATEIMTDVLAGLDHAHRANVIHRDLKPSNVFIVQGGRAKILDFGLAHIDQAVHLSSDAEIAAHIDGVAAPMPSGGTPPYMAPEQWRRSAQGARTDIWAAGGGFIELPTGEPPPPRTGAELLRGWSSAGQGPPAILSRRSALPESLDRIVAAGLRKDRRQRFQTAA